MNSMNFIGLHKLYGLQSSLACSEGTLQSYDSCFDVRAWSHDLRKRDLYLREWIKYDMPLCVVPISTIISFFSAMTCRSRGKTTPRCHPDCKSKAVLDSITASCEAMRECLKADLNMAKFLCEEELETSTWPCEKCLEALKNIKMFWRILLERVFAINLTKNKCCKHEIDNCESVRDVARIWERDMVQQAAFVKSMIPQLCPNLQLDKCCKKSCLKKCSSLHSITPPCSKGDGCCKQTTSCVANSQNDKFTKKVTLNCSVEKLKTLKKACKCVSAVVKTTDACCGCSDGCDSEIRAQIYRASIDKLQSRNCCQKEEIERLKQENKSLKCELQNLKCCQWKSPIFCATALKFKQDDPVITFKPFESYIDDDTSSKGSAKGTESELLITMKNCKHENFKHVSLLQVLHKTNNPSIQEELVDKPCYKNEDPIELLSKVQETLGAMVKREMELATTTQKSSFDSEIEASFPEIEASFQSIGAIRPSDSELSIRYGIQ